MPVTLTSDQIWQAIDNEMFAVLGTTNKQGAARTAGILYKTKDKRFFISTTKSSLKARNVEQHPAVSLTITIAKHIWWMPWVKLPPATITFHGDAKVYGHAQADPAVAEALIGKLELSEAEVADLCVVEVSPTTKFITYGVGVPLGDMTNPALASGSAPA